MSKTRFASIDDYIASQPAATQVVLDRVRRTIRAALPDAEEAIAYQIPAFTIGGRVAVYFAGWRTHYSIYPALGPLRSALRKDLARYDVSKGTIRFPLDEPVSVRLIARIAKFRAKAVAARAKITAATRPTSGRRMRRASRA